MEVINIEEQEDGSALVTLNMTEEENNMLVGFAVNTILKEQIEKMEKENKKMREVKIGICFLDKEDKILVMKPLEANWTVDAEQDLNKDYGNHVIEEIANILTEGVKLALTSDIVKEMLVELKECQE